jgi:hypothetical protein
MRSSAGLAAHVWHLFAQVRIIIEEEEEEESAALFHLGHSYSPSTPNAPGGTPRP